MELHEKMNIEGQNPPSQLWDQIATQIPEGEQIRIYDMVIEPPSSCWTHIEQRLQKKAPVIRFQPSTLLRYAAMLAFALFTSLIVLSPSFRSNITQALQGNTIKAALPEPTKIMDSIHSHKTLSDSTQTH